MSRTPKPTHPIVEILWLAWFGNAVVAIITNWPGQVAPSVEETALVGVVLGSFFVMEFIGWSVGKRKRWGGTFSEVVWFRVPLWWMRVALGLFLALGAYLLLSKLAGIILGVWLTAHFGFQAGHDLLAEDEARERMRQRGGYETDRLEE